MRTGQPYGATLGPAVIAAGKRTGLSSTNMLEHDPAWWQNLHTRVEQAARTPQSRATGL